MELLYAYGVYFSLLVALIEFFSWLGGNPRTRRSTIITVVAIVVFLIFMGLKLNTTHSPQMEEWISPDGAHYWLHDGKFAPRYVNGEVLMEDNWTAIKWTEAE